MVGIQKKLTKHRRMYGAGVNPVGILAPASLVQERYKDNEYPVDGLRGL